jgi:type III restriction enzyme
MNPAEVSNPILNSPFEEPQEYWFIQEGSEAKQLKGRRKSTVFPPRNQTDEWDTSDGTLKKSSAAASAYELVLVNLIRERVKAWRAEGYPGTTRTTAELLQYWRREGRERRLFFAQLEAAETVIFLNESRSDFRQGVSVPMDEPSKQQQAEGMKAFRRYAAKVATGGGKTTIMGMLAAWSILNKITDRSDGRFSDAVLVICPNVTIRSRLAELDPESGEASVYRKRDLVPPQLMPSLRQGKLMVTNWHIFEPQTPQTGGISAKVTKVGVPIRTKELLNIGVKNTTARGSRYVTLQELDTRIANGMLAVVDEERDKENNLKRVWVESVKYIESETGWLNRVLGKDFGGKQNLLIMNDEAHHAYRICNDVAEDDDDDEDDDDYDVKEATVWVEGLDRIHKGRGINLCLDFSATPFFLSRVGRDTNRPFPWVVSDFGLIEAIESGLVKIPQLAVRDSTGADIPGYFNIWNWILPQLTSAERGGTKANPKPEAILKYAHHPIAMLAGLWLDLRKEWEETKKDDPRPPVFILVCKNTKIAKVMFEWLALNKQPTGIPPAKIDGFLNVDGRIATIRVDSKVVHETDTGEAKSDESRWMRFTLDTVGRLSWSSDPQGRPIYPEGFEELAQKMEKPLDPPGRNIRCIVSVGMLTEGWDCNTVTHIIGLRPFMSQLLCEQVVGRGLRRASYDLTADGKFSEEVAKVFGVPFEVIPYKADPQGGGQKREKRYHVYAVPAKVPYEIKFPRVEGYARAIRNQVIVDWNTVPLLRLVPGTIPPEVDVKGTLPNNHGRPSVTGPGRLESITLNPYRQGRRFQELVFDMAAALTREYKASPKCEVPVHVLFPQMRKIVETYLREYVEAVAPADILDVFLSPYYGWVIERLVEAIRPDTSQGEAPEIPRYEANRGPGSTAEVDFWTSREPREIVHSHLNYMVPDTAKWEQTAAYYIDNHPMTDAFVKNAGLGFSVPYLHNGQMHDYIPDFIIRLKTPDKAHLILETKGYDPLTEVKAGAAERWVAAVNADGTYGKWVYRIARKPEEVRKMISDVCGELVKAVEPVAG